jgi:hypothetical protein
MKFQIGEYVKLKPEAFENKTKNIRLDETLMLLEQLKQKQNETKEIN